MQQDKRTKHVVSPYYLPSPFILAYLPLFSLNPKARRRKRGKEAQNYSVLSCKYNNENRIEEIGL
jgi:hypothetical protein